MRFDNKVAIITGGASGIGLATAKRLGSEGARIVLADLKQENIDKALPEIKKAGAPDVLGCVCNVSNEAQVEATVAETLKQFGRLDVVVNNAGLMEFKLIEQLTGDDWLRTLSVDLLGAFYFTKQAMLHMQKGGSVVNISSIHAYMTEAMVAPYAASKAAVLSLTRSSAIEGSAKGLRFNAVLPGAIDTPMLWDNPNVKSGKEKVTKDEIGEPDNVAAAVAYLASEDANFIQGAELRVDGGRLTRL